MIARMQRWLSPGCVVVALTLAAPAVMAGDPPPRREFDAPPLTSRWLARLGGLASSYKTRAAFAPSGFAAGIIQLEDDLGLDENVQTVLLYGSYRIGPRQSVDITLNRISRDSLNVIDETIDWRDLQFQVGAQVTTELDIDQFKTRWRYDFADSERLNAGMSAGLSTFGIDIALSGEASINGNPPVQGASAGSDFIAPIPVVGFFIEYAFSPKFVMRSSLDTMRLDAGDTEARILETGITWEYYPTKLFGIGLGFANSDIEYSQSEDDQLIAVGYRVSGVTGHVSFAF